MNQYIAYKLARERVLNEVAFEHPPQKYSSKKTSINSKRLPALFSKVDFEPGSLNLDMGGGAFDNVAEYLKDKYDATNLVYDTYNRSPAHNKEVLRIVEENGGADTVTLSNVLNVIEEEEVRLSVLKNCKKALKPGGTCYITVYEKDGTGEGRPTGDDSYQLNRKLKSYISEVEQVFKVTKRGSLLICR